MSIGAGIFFAAVGAILAFAVQDSINGIDLTMIGYILMGAGALMLLVGLVFRLKPRKTAVTTSKAVDPATGEGIEKREQAVT